MSGLGTKNITAVVGTESIFTTRQTVKM
jgi:hypothetical protein